jgi:hypothetical protein
MLVPKLNADDAFWRGLSLSEEDRREWTTTKWDGSYRWFRSTNIIALEHYRSRAEWSRICAVLLPPARR